MADATLADIVLADRLTTSPAAALVAAFQRHWIEPLGDGEFFWPVESVDAWLASARPARLEVPCPPAPVPSQPQPALALEGAL